MKPFNRERYLYWLLGAVMGVNALFFAYGVVMCSRAKDPVGTCPNIGARFDNYSEKALAAVLGLIAGAGAITLSQRSSSSDLDASASQPLQPLQPPSPEESVPEKVRKKASSPPEHQEPPRSSRKP